MCEYFYKKNIYVFQIFILFTCEIQHVYLIVVWKGCCVVLITNDCITEVHAWKF